MKFKLFIKRCLNVLMILGKLVTGVYFLEWCLQSFTSWRTPRVSVEMNGSQYISICLIFCYLVSTETCSVTLNFRLWACLSSAMMNSHRALRCLQELGAPYRTQTLFLTHSFLMSDWEMLPADMLTSSENQPWYDGKFQIVTVYDSPSAEVSVTCENNIFISKDHKFGKICGYSHLHKGFPFWARGWRNLSCKCNELTSIYNQEITVNIFLQAYLNYSIPTEPSLRCFHNVW